VKPSANELIKKRVKKMSYYPKKRILPPWQAVIICAIILVLFYLLRGKS
jgi:hypothetical protein